MGHKKEMRRGELVHARFIAVAISTIVLVILAQAVCFATTVGLQWDAVSDSSLAGYKVYYQADTSSQPFSGAGAVQGSSPVDVHNQTTTTISGLDPAHAYYLAVTAYDASGLESGYSNIVYVPELVAPTVTVTSPANNATVSGTVTVTAGASDNVGVTKVEFYQNGVLRATDTNSPYTYSWDTSALTAGTYTLSAKAYDAAGNVGQSSTISVAVVKDTVAPTVAVTAPSANATVSGIVTVRASASDNVGVTKVEFYENGVLLSATNVAPYSCLWNTQTLANGSYTLTAKAYDASNNVKQSAGVAVTVSNSGPPQSSLAGDINGDGIVDIGDALLSMQISVGLVQPTSGQVVRGDVAPVVNGVSVPDGVIDLQDALIILKVTTGLLAF